VVKQLPVEMLKQRLSAISSVRERIVTEERYTECQHSSPFVLKGLRSFFFSVSQ
jgi:hypothetical protein